VIRSSSFCLVVVTGVLATLGGCGGEAISQPTEPVIEVAPDLPGVIEVAPDLPGVPVFTVEDLARHSDIVVIASGGRNVENVRFRPDPSGDERSYAIVELKVEEVLGSADGFVGDSVAVWMPESVFPAGNLPDRYVLFLRRPPREFDATALEHLAKHTNPTILLPGVTPIVDVSGSDVSIRGGLFYGLRSVDAEAVPGPNGANASPPFVLSFTLENVREVAQVYTGLGPQVVNPGPVEVTVAEQE